MRNQSLSLSLSLLECLFRQMLVRRNKSVDASCVSTLICIPSFLSAAGGTLDATNNASLEMIEHPSEKE